MEVLVFKNSGLEPIKIPSHTTLQSGSFRELHASVWNLNEMARKLT